LTIITVSFHSQLAINNSLIFVQLYLKSGHTALQTVNLQHSSVVRYLKLEPR